MDRHAADAAGEPSARRARTLKQRDLGLVKASLATGSQVGRPVQPRRAIALGQRRLRQRRETQKVEFVPTIFRRGPQFKAANGTTFALYNFSGPGALPLYELAGFR